MPIKKNNHNNSGDNNDNVNTNNNDNKILSWTRREEVQRHSLKLNRPKF